MPLSRLLTEKNLAVACSLLNKNSSKLTFIYATPAGFVFLSLPLGHSNFIFADTDKVSFTSPEL
jgi:hypothetical protein